jgi:hypothetical protein
MQKMNFAFLADSGIARLYIREKNKSLFLECPTSHYIDVAEFLRNIKKGICNNAQFLKDYQEIGLVAPEIYCYEAGIEYKNPEFRKKKLESILQNWTETGLYN